MPAARHRSASPFSAEAVSATIGVRARAFARFFFADRRASW